MEIKWFKDNASDLFATINNNNIVLNKLCEKLFDDYAYCILGYSENDKKIYIKPESYNSIENNMVDAELYKLNFNRSYIRVSCTNFIRIVSDNLRIDFSNNLKFSASWDGAKGILIINLEN